MKYGFSPVLEFVRPKGAYKLNREEKSEATPQEGERAKTAEVL